MKFSKLWLLAIGCLLAAFVIPAFADIPNEPFTVEYTVESGSGEFNGTHTFTFNPDLTFTSDSEFAKGGWAPKVPGSSSEKIVWWYESKYRHFQGTFCPDGEGYITSAKLDGLDRSQHSAGTCSEIKTRD